MAHRNFYMVLGVPLEASPADIRAAYRNLAKEHHPDRRGPLGAEAFRRLAEAYEVLSDPDRRAAYNREIRAGGAAGHSDVESLVTARPLAAESLSPYGVSIDRAFHDSRPAGEAAYRDWIERHCTGRHLPKSDRIRSVDVDVILSPEEAEYGGLLPMRVPSLHRCLDCDGAGRVWLYPCGQCGGEGVLRRSSSVRIHLTPRIASGTVWEIPLLAQGICLRLHIRVAGTGFRV